MSHFFFLLVQILLLFSLRTSPDSLRSFSLSYRDLRREQRKALSKHQHKLYDEVFSYAYAFVLTCFFFLFVM